MKHPSLAWNASAPRGDSMGLLLSAIDALTLEPQFERFFARAADVVREFVGADGAALIVLDGDGCCRYEFFHGAPKQQLGSFAGYRFRADAGIVGLALQDARSVFVADYAAHPCAIRAFIEAGLRANLVIPLQGSAGALGALAVSWFQESPESPDPYRLALAERVAQQIAIAYERRQLEERLSHLANRDALTGLANRAQIMNVMGQRLEARAENRRPFAVTLIDLDGFKAVNDEQGHAVGDQVLRDIGRRLVEVCRRDDDVGRLGGDEFVVVSECPNGQQDLEPLLRRIRTVLNVHIPLGRRAHRVSASMGVAMFPVDGHDPEVLLRRADLAMYRVKREGGHEFRYFDSELEYEVQQKHSVLDELELGLTRGELQLAFQPVVVTTDLQALGAEALLRWNHPVRGQVTAGEFISMLEQHGQSMVRRLGRWVLESAADQLVEWTRRGLGLCMHVNVSACYFLNGCFIRDLEGVLATRPEINRSDLIVELTETALLEDLGRAATVMETCRDMGVRLALDDFGTGYASLTYLKRLRVDMVKIDRSFIRDLAEQPHDRGIVRGILAMAAALNLAVVAEGVESPAHHEALLELGCDQMQGFGIGNPMSAEEFAGWLAERDVPRQRA